eukprot:NODE_2788_length_540_cov_188.598778_g2403_i0.p2 GENE.NODE_2788_length_540_cov_188.598778_g2403_i0~~NODE_2788_length_540_cov_188.598778_g2403_i0.p2  ORF type:complete len:112 (-),score=50.74 NODE_2788_length_540_cov_188.598778_g2403_i0:205-510(-)
MGVVLLRACYNMYDRDGLGYIAKEAVQSPTKQQYLNDSQQKILTQLFAKFEVDSAKATDGEQPPGLTFDKFCVGMATEPHMLHAFLGRILSLCELMRRNAS